MSIRWRVRDENGSTNIGQTRLLRTTACGRFQWHTASRTFDTSALDFIDEAVLEVRSFVPRFLIEDELRDGRLLSIVGRHLPGVTEELVAARRRDRPHGPVANRLWEYLERHAASLRSVLGTTTSSLGRVTATITRAPKRKRSRRRT